MKNKKNKAFTLIEILIYTTLLSLVTLFLIQIVIYYNKSSRIIDQINALQIRINAALTILDFDFTNAGYTALQDGVVLSRFYFVNSNGQVVDNNIASDVRKIILTNNGFVDRVGFNYFELEENNLAFISNATLLGGGNSAEIDIPNSVNMNDPAFRNVWPDPNLPPNPDPNDVGSSAYPVIAYVSDSNGNFIGVLFYITRVQYPANHMQHRPLTFYGGNLNKDIIDYLPSNSANSNRIVSLIKPRNIFRLNYYVDNNGNLIRQVYNFRTDNQFTRDVILTNVESFNIEVALDQDNDNQPDLDNNQEIRWFDFIPNGLEDRVAMLRYTIVLRSNIRNLVGLDRNPLTNQGNDGFKRLMLYRTVTLRNIVNPSI
jgi:type II secretory pathway pseudopilin PulG